MATAQEVNVGFTHTYAQVAASLTTTYLKLTKEGSTFTGYYSADGQNWIQVEQYIGVNFENFRIGLMAVNAWPNPPEIPADFDFFHVDSEAMFSISGHVQDDSGKPISGVTISAGAGGSAVTDVSGAYTLTGLPAGEYVLRPSKASYAFAPDAITIQLNANRSGVNFRGRTVACAVPVSDPFLQFPLAGYRTAGTFARAKEDTDDQGLLDSWFDHDTPEYGYNHNRRVRL